MGSWNETCMMSNLPILPGEQVVMILLSANPFTDSSSGCYSNDFFFVRSIPLFGEYADYGRMELAKGEKNKFEYIKRQFAIDVITREQNERDKLLGIPKVELTNMTFITLQNWLGEGHVLIDSEALGRKSSLRLNHMATLFRNQEMKVIKKGPPVITDDMDEKTKIATMNRINNWDKYVEDVTNGYGIYGQQSIEPVKPLPVVKVFIRRDVWDSFCQVKMKTWKGLNTVEHYKNGAKLWIENTFKRVKAEKLADGSADSAAKVLAIKMSLYKDKENYFAAKFTSTGIGGSPPFGMSPKEILDFMYEDIKIGKLNKTKYTELCMRLAELCFIEDIMSNNRLTWHPTTGTGSQSESWEETTELHLRMAACGARAGVDNNLCLYEDVVLDDMTDEEIDEMDEWDKKRFLEARRFSKQLKTLEFLIKD